MFYFCKVLVETLCVWKPMVVFWEDFENQAWEKVLAEAVLFFILKKSTFSVHLSKIFYLRTELPFTLLTNDQYVVSLRWHTSFYKRLVQTPSEILQHEQQVRIF